MNKVDYNSDVVNKPRINGVPLVGDKSSEDLHIQGGGGTSNYNDLSNKPQINGNTLSGNKSAADLGLSAADTADSTVTFTSDDNANPTALANMPAVLATGETHKSLFNKISTVVKNVRYLISLLGSTDISQLGNGTITGGLIASITRNNATFTAKNAAGTDLFTFTQKDMTSYPKVYVASGAIANAANDPMIGHGIATVVLYASGLAEIHYEYLVTTAGTGGSVWGVGLNRDLLKQLNANIPTITPIQAGSMTFYNPRSGGTWGLYGASANGYAGINGAYNQFWTVARNYNGASIGGHAAAIFTLDSRVKGVAFGTFTPT